MRNRNLYGLIGMVVMLIIIAFSFFFSFNWTEFTTSKNFFVTDTHVEQLNEMKKGDAVETNVVRQNLALVDSVSAEKKQEEVAERRNLASLQQEVVRVSDFGAKGDGVTDDAGAIRKAINYAKNHNIKTIVFDEKTYLLRSTVNGIYLPLSSNLVFVGQGKNTVLLQAAGKLKDEDPKVFFSEEYVENIRFHNFSIDLNGKFNLGPFVTKRANIAIGAKRAKNIEISNIIFSNNAGRQTIMIGNMLKAKHIFDIKISNCKFVNMGNGVKGNHVQTDHSCIYVVAERLTCTDNIFYNDPMSNQLPVSTAIESHSDFTRAERNTISNFKNAFNIVATVSSHTNSTYTNNICNNVMRLAEFWVWNNNKMDKIVLENNKLLQNIPAEAISLSTQVKSPINSLRIVKNHIEFVGKRSQRYAFPSITSTLVRNLMVQDNVFKNLPSGVLLSTSKAGLSPKLTITNNQIIDCGNTEANTSLTQHTAFLLNGTDGGDLIIEGNTVRNSEPTGFIERGVILDNRWQNKSVNKNVFDKVTREILDNRR